MAEALSGKDDGESDFLSVRLQGLENQLREVEVQIAARMNESERKLEEIAREIDRQEWEFRNVFSGDPGVVNSQRSRIASALSSLKRQYRDERIQALKDVSALRMKRAELISEIETRRKLLPDKW